MTEYRGQQVVTPKLFVQWASVFTAAQNAYREQFGTEMPVKLRHALGDVLNQAMHVSAHADAGYCVTADHSECKHG